MNRVLINTAKQFLPENFCTALKYYHYSQQIKRGCFVSPEKEFACLQNWVGQGDWVLDIGANVGHYTRQMSSLVGETGRVIAIEPHPHTFAHLAFNVSDLKNVTLINGAATNETTELGFSVPVNNNYYMAKVDNFSTDKVLGIDIGSIAFPEKIDFVKIDAEGHDLVILGSLDNIIHQHKPILLIEGHRTELIDWADQNGYYVTAMPGSHNHILEPEFAVEESVVAHTHKKAG